MGGEVEFLVCTLRGNLAGKYEGGVFSRVGRAVFVDSIIEGNSILTHPGEVGRGRILTLTSCCLRHRQSAGEGAEPRDDVDVVNWMTFMRHEGSMPMGAMLG